MTVHLAEGKAVGEATTKNTKNAEVFWDLLVRYRC